MRKALIILLLFCMTFLFSCSSENSIFDSNNSNVVIKGKVNWTDYGKNIHGARHAKVRIWNDEVLFNRLVTEVIADENGYYEISLKKIDKYGKNGKGLYIEFYPETEHAKIKNNSDENFYIRNTITSSDFNNNVAEYNVTFGTDLCGKAFPSLQAIEYADKYVAAMSGIHLPQMVIDFPVSYPNGTYYDNEENKIYLAELNYCDWDVIMHEYGHYVEDMFEFSYGVGGNYFINEILTERFRREVGIQKAWNEGWATYFALSCQKYLSVYDLEILDLYKRNNFGDNYYDDTKIRKLTGIRIDVKNMWRLGEGSVIGVAGFLLCLADADTSSIDPFSYGYKDIWDLSVGKQMNNMPDFYQCLCEKYPTDLAKIDNLKSYFRSDC